jgi:uncharacterized membrane protein
MNDKGLRVLLAGESWISYGIHIKGFAAYTTGTYEEGLAPLANALDGFAELIYLPNHQAILGFPDTVKELAAFDVVLFSDIGADTLLLHPDTLLRSIVRPNRLRVVQEFVAQGGGFGMIGGYMSFAGYEGKANYRNTPIAEILPVVIESGDDRIETPEGFSPEIVDASHQILQGIATDWPVLLGYNRVVAKPHGQVLMRQNNDPFLVVGTYGKGRTLAYASDCSPHWGSPQFVNWEYYGPFWRQLVTWLAGRA